jgi:hypothetical protein
MANNPLFLPNVYITGESMRSPHNATPANTSEAVQMSTSIKVALNILAKAGVKTGGQFEALVAARKQDKEAPLIREAKAGVPE